MEEETTTAPPNPISSSSSSNDETDGNQVEILGDDDFVYSRHFNAETGEHYVSSGGYRIKSSWLQGGNAPMATWAGGLGLQSGGDNHTNKRVSELFEHLAVPTGLLALYPQKGGSAHTSSALPSSPLIDVTTHSVISDDLFDRLFSLAEVVSAGGGSSSGKAKEKDKDEDKEGVSSTSTIVADVVGRVGGGKRGGGRGKKTKRARGGGGGGNKRRSKKQR